MKSRLTALSFALTCALLLPAAARPGAAEEGRSAAAAGSCRWFMVEAGSIMNQGGGGERLAGLCERAHKDGYNGLLLWDRNLWERRLPGSYRENARTLRRALDRLHFTLMIEMCPRGAQLVQYSGDSSMVEPRPANPTSEERDYRYLCLSHPGVIPLWEEQIRRAEEFYRPDGWLLGAYDEIRVAAADERCRRSGKTPAQLLADHARATIAMVRRVTPGRVVAVWNDMFDPYDNAKPGRYYHVAEGFSGSWEAIDKDVLILDWNDKIESFRFWAERGNPQIFCGYYDGELGPDKEASLVQRARQYPGVIGWMYTTWKANFSAMRPYLALTGFRPARASGAGTDLPALFLKSPKKDAPEEKAPETTEPQNRDLQKSEPQRTEPEKSEPQGTGPQKSEPQKDGPQKDNPNGAPEKDDEDE